MGRRWWGDGESRQDPWEGVGERHPGAGGGGGGLSICTDTPPPRGTGWRCHGGTSALGDKGTG